MTEDNRQRNFLKVKPVSSYLEIIPCERGAGAALDLQGNHSAQSKWKTVLYAGAALDLQGNHSDGWVFYF